jgi:ornithine--oxo-acid transaminase
MTVLSEAPVAADLYEQHVNPQWVRLLNLLQMNVEYTRCLGTELQTRQGRCILDFLSGYCVYNTGHNHPHIIAAIVDELYKSGPVMLQSHIPDSAAQLAARLSQLAGGRLEKVFFTSSGSEGIETVIKFSRAFTRRSGLLYCQGAFHGLTCGALSLMGDSFWRDGFGPLLPDTVAVPFGALEALEEHLSTRRFAAFLLEPIQAEAGICVPPASFLQEAQALCRRYGTLFVLDEVQTGMFRTGPFLAAHHFGLDPDMVVLAKALSGGLVPCGAVLMTRQICQNVYSSLSRSFIHASTFGESALAMRAGLATLEVLEAEQLGDRALQVGDRLRARLAEAARPFEMVAGVAGMGLLNGIRFQPPRHLRLRVPFEGFKRIHPGMFGQMLVKHLFQKHNILTQMCGNNFLVIKVAPPLVVTQQQIDAFVAAMAETFDYIHNSTAFWSDALGLGQRALHALIC